MSCEIRASCPPARWHGLRAPRGKLAVVGTTELRSAGDRDLAEILLADHEIRRAIDKWFEELEDDTRRHLLATAVRISPVMAPRLHELLEHCRNVLEIELPIELYVMANPQFNAFSYASEGKRVYVGVTSSLLEALEEDELLFVVGHELGHHKFEHHKLPVRAILHRSFGLRAEQALRLFSWMRFAEVSADRAGLVCAGALAPTARAFFKISSGLGSGRMAMFDMEEYLAQLVDIEAEASAAREQAGKHTGDLRADYFASHPFSPLRARVAQLTSQSVLFDPAGMSIDELEQAIQELMGLMDPSYLHDRSETGEAMRRLLFAGGVMVAAADGVITDEERRALEGFLGEGNLPPSLNPEALAADMQRRIELARAQVPRLKRAQVVRDLCVIAHADGRMSPVERAVIRDLADRLEVDPLIVECTATAVNAELD